MECTHPALTAAARNGERRMLLRRASRLLPRLLPLRPSAATVACSAQCVGWSARPISLSAQSCSRSVAAHARSASAAPPAPPPPENRVTDVELASEASSSFLSYAMSVIVGRALPDVRDGLKPVHRRILYAMHDLGLRPSKPFRKCARVVGEVLGKYHPHGDQAVYDTLVRMAQDFAMGEPLVAGHGNFGSLDADPPAAMRYTECKLQPLSDAMLLADLSESTVAYTSTFDGSQNEPAVLPARLPNLLLNGSTGIAVGMATSIPPHNLSELVDALTLVARKPGATLQEVLAVMPAPDFPTGGTILAGEPMLKGYHTGNGGFTLRGTATIQTLPDKPAREAVIISEIPHGGNKATLVTRLAELVNERVIEGVSDIRDESDRDGMRVVIELRKGVDPEVVRAALFKHTRLSIKVNMNMIALVEGAPVSLGLLDILRHFVAFRSDVLRKRAAAALRTAAERAHIVQGLRAALADMDATVAAIRAAPDAVAAARALTLAMGLTDVQAAAVLAMPLRRLTGLETGKLVEEDAALRAQIADLEDLLAKPERVVQLLVEEAQELKARFGRPRRTQLGGLDALKAVAEESAALEAAKVENLECIVTLSERGYIKRMRPSEFAGREGKALARGTRGKTGGRLRSDDAMMRVLTCRDTDTVMLFTQRGRAFVLPAHSIPEGSRTSGGTPVPQLVDFEAGEHPTAVLSLTDFGKDSNDTLIMLSEKGWLKRMQLSELASIKGRTRGLTALKLDTGDTLRFVRQARGDENLLIASSNGFVVRFNIDDGLSITSRTSRGVRSMDLRDQATLVGMDVLPASLLPAAAPESGAESDGAESGAESDGEGTVSGPRVSKASASPPPWALLVTQSGLAKRVALSEFRTIARGGKGKFAIKLGEGDKLVSLRVVGLPPSKRTGKDVRRPSRSGNDSESESEAEEEAAAEAVEEEVVVATEAGVINRCRISAIRVMGRTARGTKVMKLGPTDLVSSIAILPGSGAEES